MIRSAKRFYNRWLNKRLPPMRKVTLTQKQIFIFPNRVGSAFVAVLMSTLIAAINYENSLIYGLTFLLGALFIVCILHTFNNLSGLTITVVKAHSCIAGEMAEIDLTLSRDGKKRFENVVLRWDSSTPVTADLIYDREVPVKLYIRTYQRGVMKPGRLLVETFYPVGFLRAWTWLDMDISILVFPKPVAGGQLLAPKVLEHDGELLADNGEEDFSGLVEYYPGVSLKHVAWKNYARGQELLVKEFSAYVDRRIWIDWGLFGGLDTESRLSRMCHWALEVEKTTDEFGLRLPGITIQPGKGGAHMTEALTALALFEAKPA
jgi:uncharacterized protein (DUF58 family)